MKRSTLLLNSRAKEQPSKLRVTGKSFHVIVREGTVGTISFYFHFVMHVTTRGHSVTSLVVKLD